MVITGRTRNAFGIISHVGSNPTFSAKNTYRPLFLAVYFFKGTKKVLKYLIDC